MQNEIILSHDQLTEVLNSLSSISELFRKLPSKPENAAVMYAIMSNITVIPRRISACVEAVQSVRCLGPSSGGYAKVGTQC
jgi:hypothetical protein